MAKIVPLEYREALKKIVLRFSPTIPICDPPTLADVAKIASIKLEKK